jgi:hypothetical protein
MPDAMPHEDLVNVMLTKAGSGTVHSSPVDTLKCDPACAMATASFARSTQLTLEATPAPGQLFVGWTGACTGIARSCTVTLADNTTISATFKPITANVVFMTAATFDGNLGGLAGADQKCADEASAVGLSGHYVALLSTDTVNATARLVVPGTQTPARGFVRMDGLPVADKLDDLFSKNVMWYPVLYDAQGHALLSSDYVDGDDQFALTGSWGNGLARPGSTCDGFTNSSDTLSVRTGETGSGPGTWMSSVGGSCAPLGVYGKSGHLYCAGVDSTQPVTLASPPAGKRIYTTKGDLHMGGRAAADALCAAEKPAGAVTVKALLTTTDAPAANVLKADTTYLRVDGTVVGTGAQLIAVSRGQGLLGTGIWQHGDGSYADEENNNGYRWLGVPGEDAGLDVVGTAASTCADWTASDGRSGGSFGYSKYVHHLALTGRPNYSCYDDYLPIFCVEQ